MHWITRPGWPGNLLAIVAGGLTALAQAPFNIWTLTLVTMAVFYLGFRGLSPRVMGELLMSRSTKSEAR